MDIDDREPAYLKSIRISNTPPASMGGYNPENALRLDRLSQKVTFITILIPCIIIAICVVAYLDISNRVTQAKQSGEDEVKQMMSAFEGQINAHSIKYAKFMFDTDETIKTLNQTITATTESIKNIVTNVEKIEASKLNQSEFNTVVQQTTEKIAQLESIQSKLQQAIATWEKQFNEYQAAFTENIKNQLTAQKQSLLSEIHVYADLLNKIEIDVSKISLSVSQLQEEKMSKATMDSAIHSALNVAMEKEKKYIDEQMEKMQQLIETRIESKLENRLNTLKSQLVPPTPVTTPKDHGKPVIKGVPKNGKFIEQDLKE